MKVKYFQAENSGRDRWMISYMDILTILLIFFVALAAQSLARLQAKPAPEPRPVAPAKPRVEPEPESRRILRQAQQKLQAQGLDPRLDRRGLIISLPQAILFAPGEVRVSPDALPIVAQIADILRDIPNKISLEGHADATPIHGRQFKDNWELSAARSLNILKLLSSRYDIPESRLSAVSYGPYRPSGSNDTKDGRATNRRVDIAILEEPALP